MFAGLSTGAPIKTLRWGTWKGGHLTCTPTVSRLALATEGAMRVNTGATIETQARLAALINVIAAVLSLEARWAGTVVVVIPVGTTSPIGTGTCGTGINEGAVLAWRLNSEFYSVKAGTFGLTSLTWSFQWIQILINVLYLWTPSGTHRNTVGYHWPPGSCKLLRSDMAIDDRDPGDDRQDQ